MILPYLTSEFVHVGFLVLIAFIALICSAICYYNIEHKIFKKTLTFTIAAIGLLILFEIFYQLSRPTEKLFEESSFFHVEHRIENNRLYIFKDNKYHPVSDITQEYVQPGDTIYFYSYIITCGQLQIDNKTIKTTKPLHDISWVDSVSFEKYNQKHHQKILLQPEDFIDESNNANTKIHDEEK